jgi:hypothetical protein
MKSLFARDKSPAGFELWICLEKRITIDDKRFRGVDTLSAMKLSDIKSQQELIHSPQVTVNQECTKETAKLPTNLGVLDMHG